MFFNGMPQNEVTIPTPNKQMQGKPTKPPLKGQGYGMQAPMTFTPKPSSSMLPSILGRIGVKGG